jgi:hypothetical protein
VDAAAIARVVGMGIRPEAVLVLIQFLLPTRPLDGARPHRDLLQRTHDEIVERFGGLTAYLRSPAAGVWTSPEGRLEEDSVVMIEVLARSFDTGWWRGYVKVLEERFDQESIHVRATEVQVLDE